MNVRSRLASFFKGVYNALVRVQGTTNSTILGVLVLVIFYIFLLALILIFSQEVLLNYSSLNPVSNIIIIILAVLLIIFLLGAIIFQLARLIRERARKSPGVKLKTRLIIFFTVIVILALLPQGILSFHFINLSINFWFTMDIVAVLEGGLDVAIQYYTDRVENLATFTGSREIEILLEGISQDPGRVWRRISRLNPAITLFQVFHGEEEVFFYGVDQGRLSRFWGTAEAGELPRVERDTLSIIRRYITYEEKGEKYVLVFGVVLEKTFNDYAERITTTLRQFRQLSQYKGVFNIAVIVFYFFFTFPIFLLAILISFFLTGEIIRPIVHLEEATRRVAEGDFSIRILTRMDDELSILVDSFNKMVSELAASRKKILHAEKITAWQEIARQLAHEIKNPLTPIKLGAQRLLRKYQMQAENFGEVLDRSVTAIVHEVDNLTSMLGEFSSFARLPDPLPEQISLRDILDEVGNIYHHLDQTLTVDYQGIGADVKLFVDRNQIRQVFANLFKNSIDAMPDGGSITITGDVVEKMTHTFYRVQFRDSGTGIPEEMVEKIFNPYFTTKKGGTGLGLAIVERIVFDHNGNIWFESKPGEGTTFFIDLPVRGDS